MLVLALLAICATLGFAHDIQPAATPKALTHPCHEEDPCWNGLTMGNHIACESFESHITICANGYTGQIYEETG